MARTTPSAADVGLNCAPNWVSFSCSGDFNSVAIGNQKFANAQLAFVTGGSIIIAVNDNAKHNGYCVASRAYNTK